MRPTVFEPAKRSALGLGALPFCGLALLVGLSGCLALKSDQDKLAARIAALEEDKARMEAKMAEDVAKLQDLHTQLDAAEKTLRRSGANLGLRMEHLEQDFPRVRGEVESLVFMLNRLEDDIGLIKEEIANRLGSLAVYLPKNLPKDAEGLWRAAEAKKRSGDTQVARAIYQMFEASFPEDPRADDALFEQGKLLEQEGDIDGAIKVYVKVESRYGQGDTKGDQVTKAVYRVGELYEVQGKCKQAKGVYDYLAKSYKGDALAERAKARAKEVKAACKPKP